MLPGSDVDPVGWLFDDTLVHQIDLTLELVDLQALQDEPAEKVAASVIIDGHAAPEIGVRLRGKLGSFQEVDEKPKWKLDFNWAHPDRSFFGLDSLALNNSVVDCSYVREKLAYTVYGMAGVVVPRVTWAEVTVNGEAYGLYQVIESPDRPFLDRVMPDPTGNLYDGKYLWDGRFDITTLDFDETARWMQLEEGTDVGHADVFAVVAGGGGGGGRPGAGQLVAATEPVVDWPQVQALFAGEIVADHFDGYAMNQNNYRVWFDPVTGKAQLLPWDLDYTFLNDWWIDNDWPNPDGLLAQGCFDDATCRSQQAEVLADLLDAVEAVDWEAEVLTWGTLLQEAAMADPRGGCTVNTIRGEQMDLSAWMRDRPEELRQEWGL